MRTCGPCKQLSGWVHDGEGTDAEEGGEHNSKMGLYEMHAIERPCCIDGHGGCQGGGKQNSRIGSYDLGG